MRMQKRNWMSTVVAAALGSVAVTSVAVAAPTTEQSGSVLVFPKVMGTSGRDTLIQISNTGNATAYAHCFYINAAIDGRWIEMDFNIWLTKQQPTHWLASSGRRVDLSDPFGSDGSGFDPGLVPPVPSGFQGELRCVQVDESGAPLRANKLTGSATLIRNNDGDTSEYNAIAIPGNPDAGVGNNDNVLMFNNTDSNDGEYDACPDTLTINTFSNLTPFSDDPVLVDIGDCPQDGDCPTETTLTLVPCTQDLERLEQGVSHLTIFTWDEFEVRLSASVEVDCWANLDISSMAVFARDSLAVTARFNPVAGDGAVIGVGEELRTDLGGNTAWAAFNLHTEGNRYDAARDGEGNSLTARACAGGTNEGTSCTSDAECTGGACVNGVLDTMVLPEFP